MFVRLMNQLTRIRDCVEERSPEGCPGYIRSSSNGTLLSLFDNKYVPVVRISNHRKLHEERIRWWGLSIDAHIRCGTGTVRNSWRATMLWMSIFCSWIPLAMTLQRSTHTWSRLVSYSWMYSSCKTVSFHLSFEFDFVSTDKHTFEAKQKIRSNELENKDVWFEIQEIREYASETFSQF